MPSSGPLQWFNFAGPANFFVGFDFIIFLGILVPVSGNSLINGKKQIRNKLSGILM